MHAQNQQHQQITLERKWAKPKSKEETFTLPNKVDDPLGYKEAVKKNRHRLRLDFFGREGFDFFLKHYSILRTLQNTSYSEQGLDKTIVVHLYYTTGKRGRIFDFLGEKWDPYIREVTVDNGPINKTADPRDELCAAINKLQPPSKVVNKEEEEQRQQQQEEGETLENEMEVEIQPELVIENKLHSRHRDTDTKFCHLNKKEQRELNKGTGKIATTEAEAEILSEDSDSNTTKRESKELKKLKKEQKSLQKKMGIFETALRQIANLTSKMITKASKNGEAPEDVAVMRQEFNAIFHTLKQQDTDMTLPEFTFDLFLKPEELAPETEINIDQQALKNPSHPVEKEEQKAVDINNLPTSCKSPYENIFSRCDQRCGEGSGLGQKTEDLDIESPKSRDFSCSNHSDQSQNIDDDLAKPFATEQTPAQPSSSLIKTSDDEVKSIMKTPTPDPRQINSQISKSIPERKLTQGCTPLDVPEITRIMKKQLLSDDVKKFVFRIREYMMSQRVDYETMVNPNNGLILGKDWVSIMEKHPALFKDLAFLS